MPRQQIITRRNLPHWYMPGAAHFVTYRLAGTIPLQVLRQLRAQREARRSQPPPVGATLVEHRENTHKLFFADYDRFLDEHNDINWLSLPAIAELVQGNLRHHDSIKFRLLCYGIMHNHVHVLFQPIDGTRIDAAGHSDQPRSFFSDEIDDSRSPLSRIMHSLKSYTANQANKILKRTGKFWQHESYDHWVRDNEELERIVAYICHNPVRAGLVEQPHLWKYSSAYDRLMRDGATSGFLVG